MACRLFIVHVCVVDPPSFVNPRGDLGVLTGDEVTLYCMATSQDGNVTVTLSAESTNLTLPEPVVEQDGNLANSSITFTAMLEYNGTYVCTAMNRAGTVSINFTLSVISKSNIVYPTINTSISLSPFSPLVLSSSPPSHSYCWCR